MQYIAQCNSVNNVSQISEVISETDTYVFPKILDRKKSEEMQRTSSEIMDADECVVAKRSQVGPT